MWIGKQEIKKDVPLTLEQFKVSSLPAKGWTVTSPPETVPDNLNSAKEQRRQTLAASRYLEEIAGVMVAGVRINTDRESQATLTGAWVRMQQAPSLLIDWKSPTGWIKVNKELVETLCSAVGLHVQACFTKEYELCTLVDGCTTIEEVAQINW